MNGESLSKKTVESTTTFNGRTIDVIEYLHKCLCGRIWYSELRISSCPKCQRQHIWLNDTSRLKE